MNDRIRQYDLRCTDCETRSRKRVAVTDLPGGVRVGCGNCGLPTVHVSCKLHPDEPACTYCKSCDTWKGTTGTDWCDDCGAFLSELTTDESLKLV